jgi:hypothetical protein
MSADRNWRIEEARFCSGLDLVATNPDASDSADRSAASAFHPGCARVATSPDGADAPQTARTTAQHAPATARRRICFLVGRAG